LSADTKKKKVIFILPKSPIPAKGRYGPRTWQDWHRACIKAARLAAKHQDSIVLISSSFSTPQEGPEILLYKQILFNLGVPSSRIITIPEGNETIGQLHSAWRYAQTHDRELIVVHTLTHTLRVWYLCWKDDMKAQTRIGAIFALPRPKEVIIDGVLTVLFPVLDLFGRREKFLAKLHARRAGGTL
jgi:hypothetical protein